MPSLAVRLVAAPEVPTKETSAPATGPPTSLTVPVMQPAARTTIAGIVAHEPPQLALPVAIASKISPRSGAPDASIPSARKTAGTPAIRGKQYEPSLAVRALTVRPSWVPSTSAFETGLADASSTRPWAQPSRRLVSIVTVPTSVHTPGAPVDTRMPSIARDVGPSCACTESSAIDAARAKTSNVPSGAIWACAAPE